MNLYYLKRPFGIGRLSGKPAEAPVARPRVGPPGLHGLLFIPVVGIAMFRPLPVTFRDASPLPKIPL
jgi:hypothetical protein